MSEVNFSVIIPVYNVQLYLETAIASVLNQGYDFYEVILVEDCSTDQSRSLCINLADAIPKIRLICHEKNLGLGGARNTGLKEAIGKYIIFMDSDDVMHPNYLRQLHAILMDKSCIDIDLLFSMPKVFNEQTREIYEWMDLDRFNCLPKEVVISIQQYPNIYSLEVCAWRKVYSRRFLLDNHLFFPNYLKYEDFSHHFQVLLLSKTIILSQVNSIYYRLGRPNQITGARNSSRIDICKIFKLGYDFLSENEATEETYVYFHKWAIKFTTWNLSLIDNKNRMLFINMLHKYWSGIAYGDLYLDLLTPYEKACIKIFRNKFLIGRIFATEYSYKIWNVLARRYKLIRLLVGEFYE